MSQMRLQAFLHTSLALLATATLTAAASAQFTCVSGVGCQLPNQLGNGPDGTVGATSDLAAGYRVSENFRVTSAGSITSVCWWGMYVNFTLMVDCGPGDGDNFTISYFNDDGGGAVPGSPIAGPFSVTPIKAATGLTIGSSIGPIVEYGYEATHPAVSVLADQCYWVEIVNSSTGQCWWLWTTAPPGDGRSAQYNNGYAQTNYDNSLCINLNIEPDGCGEMVPEPLEYCPANSLYSQGATHPSAGWTAGTSDAGPGYKRWDNFEVDGDIQGVIWWGLMLNYNNGWFNCPGENPMEFLVEFYADAGGQPAATPACTYSESVLGENTGQMYGDFPVYKFELDLTPNCNLPSGWFAVQGAGTGTPTDCWFLWADSEVGDDNSWFFNGTAMAPDVIDLSMCLLGEVQADSKYVDGPDYDPFSPVTDPTAFPWHELWPNFCQSWDCVAWVDNGTGILDECDLLEFADGSWWHVEVITVTAVVEYIEGGPPEDWIYIEYVTPPFVTPVGLWHEVYPVFCSQWNCTEWMDNGNGVLDFCDWLIMSGPAGSEFLHVVSVATDLELLIDNVPNPCPEDINGDNVVNVLDLLAILAAWGAAGGPEDINGDGIVNVLDLLAVLAAWGPCP